MNQNEIISSTILSFWGIISILEETSINTNEIKRYQSENQIVLVISKRYKLLKLDYHYVFLQFACNEQSWAISDKRSFKISTSIDKHHIHYCILAFSIVLEQNNNNHDWKYIAANPWSDNARHFRQIKKIYCFCFVFSSQFTLKDGMAIRK